MSEPFRVMLPEGAVTPNEQTGGYCYVHIIFTDHDHDYVEVQIRFPCIFL